MNYWETPSYLGLILTMCKRNVSPKEIISHSRKPEKSLILTKLQSYNYKQCWTKQTYRSTHYTDPEGMLRLSREVKETMKPTINKDTTNFAIVVAVNHTQVTKSAQPVVLNATIATNAVISARFAKKETYLRLLSYHMTPISSTLKSPAERLNNCGQLYQCWDSSIARQHNYPPQDSQTYMKRSWRTSKPPNKLDV